MPFNKYTSNNNGQGTLLGSISAGAVTIILESGHGGRFPSTFPFLATLTQFDTVSPFPVVKREIVKVTGKTDDTLTVVRSAGTCLPNDSSTTPGTTAFTFASGDTITVTVTSEIIKDIQDEVSRLEIDKLNKAGGLRTGLTANSVLGVDGSGAETYIIGAGFVSTGMILPYAGPTAPVGYLNCDGSAVSRTTYSALKDIIMPTKGTFTVTIATPGVITLNSHGLQIGDSFFATTTGALPTGMVANTLYYVIATGFTANSFQFSTTRFGSAVNTSGTQSGVHTLTYCPYGLGNGSTTFNLPNLTGRTPVGLDNTQNEFKALGTSGGAKTHTLSITEIPAHTHSGTFYDPSNTTNTGPASAGGATRTNSVPSEGGGQAHNNLQPYLTINYIVKT